MLLTRVLSSALFLILTFVSHLFLFETLTYSRLAAAKDDPELLVLLPPPRVLGLPVCTVSVYAGCLRVSAAVTNTMTEAAGEERVYVSSQL